MFLGGNKFLNYNCFFPVHVTELPYFKGNYRLFYNNLVTFATVKIENYSQLKQCYR